MARLQISVLSCYPTVTVRGKANVNVCAFFGFSQLGETDNYNFDIPCGSGGGLKCLPQGASDVVTPLNLIAIVRSRLAGYVKNT